MIKVDDVFVGNIARIIRTVSVEDSVGMVAETLRTSGLIELPVVSNGRIAGIITEKAILDALTSGDPKEVSATPIANLVTRDLVWISPNMTVHQAAEILNQHGLQSAPVIDQYGNYRGVISRSDITGALAGTLKPPVIGGLATPLGVRLTCGNHKAGASDLGLMLSGVFLACIVYLSSWSVFGLAYLIDKTELFELWSVRAILMSQPTSAMNWMDMVRYAFLALSILVFMVLMRYSVVAGYHAAEHQTVHAIENGEPLRPEYVSRMPRVHPRCGTNILAAMALFMLIRQLLPEDLAILAAVFVIIFARQTVGGLLQHHVTTKPASEKQIKNGIRAGEELLERYREYPSKPITAWQRIWNTGMPQTMVGWGLVSWILGMLNLLPPSFLGF